MHCDDVAKAVDDFIAQVNAGNLEAALRHYDEDALFVPEPGSVVEGVPAVRTAVAQLVGSGVQIQTRSRTVLRSRDVALYCSSWALILGGVVVQEASSSDVLRLGIDGRWRIAIDNPWGAAHLVAMSGIRGEETRA